MERKDSYGRCLLEREFFIEFFHPPVYASPCSVPVSGDCRVRVCRAGSSYPCSIHIMHSVKVRLQHLEGLFVPSLSGVPSSVTAILPLRVLTVMSFSEEFRSVINVQRKPHANIIKGCSNPGQVSRCRAGNGLNWFQMLWHDDVEKAACSSVITSLNLGIPQALMVSIRFGGCVRAMAVSGAQARVSPSPGCSLCSPCAVE